MDYAFLAAQDFNSIPTYNATGVANSNASARLSYFFDWHGPAMTVDTACSSSLVAVHQAVQVLRAGTSRVAVAAGTNLITSPLPYITESKLHMLSPGGHCQMWDQRADGYARKLDLETASMQIHLFVGVDHYKILLCNCTDDGLADVEITYRG